MTGEPDLVYRRARAVLLDALDALAPHADALVLVGAQAIYLHTGASDLLVAEYTTDADLSVSPELLADEPRLGDLLEAHGFSQHEQPGEWRSPDGIAIDVMVPESLAGPGTRGARLGPHGKRVARRAKGLEGALIDRARRVVPSLDASDPRAIALWVAGPGALLVAKVHKIAERLGAPDRTRDKDALDVLRLLRALDTIAISEPLVRLRQHPVSGPVTNEAVGLLPTLFGSTGNPGVQMAVRATAGSEDPDTIARSLVMLVERVLDAVSPPGDIPA